MRLFWASGCAARGLGSRCALALLTNSDISLRKNAHIRHTCLFNILIDRPVSGLSRSHEAAASVCPQIISGYGRCRLNYFKILYPHTSLLIIISPGIFQPGEKYGNTVTRVHLLIASCPDSPPKHQHDFGFISLIHLIYFIKNKRNTLFVLLLILSLTV